MPRKGIKILKANSGSIILETTIGVDYRLSIPKSIRSLVDPKKKYCITIVEVKENE